MKKKFLISGAAVFLAVCLLTSALFAFADSNGPFFPVKVLNYSDGLVTSYSDFNNVYSGSTSTSSGGSYSWYSNDSSSYFVFEGGSTLFYRSTSYIYILYSDSLPLVGDSVSFSSIRLSGYSVGDSYGNSSIYKYVLPTTHPYYFTISFSYYAPPATLWGRVSNTVDGVIASFSGFINGCMSNSVLAVCVIVIPVFTLIVSVLFSVIPHRGRVRSKKVKSRRRR